MVVVVVRGGELENDNVGDGVTIVAGGAIWAKYCSIVEACVAGKVGNIALIYNVYDTISKLFFFVEFI